MPWYTHPPNFADPETGAFAEDFQGIVGNFHAMAGGDIGAPKISGPALGSFLGFFSLTSSGLSVTGLGRVKVVEFDLSGSQGFLSGARTLRVAFSNDGGATWGADQNIYDFSTGASLTRSDWAQMTFDLEAGAYYGRGVRVQDASGTLSPLVTSGSASSLTVPSNCNAMRFSWNTVTVTTVRMVGRCLQGVT